MHFLYFVVIGEQAHNLIMVGLNRNILATGDSTKRFANRAAPVRRPQSLPNLATWGGNPAPGSLGATFQLRLLQAVGLLRWLALRSGPDEGG